MTRTSYILPYSLVESEHGTQICRVSAGEIHTILTWKHNEISVTIDYETNCVVGLIDYLHKAIYSAKDGKLALLTICPQDMVGRGICIPDGTTEVWFSDKEAGTTNCLHYPEYRRSVVGGWAISPPPISIRRKGKVLLNSWYFPSTYTQLCTASYIEKGKASVVTTSSLVSDYAPSRAQWSVCNISSPDAVIGVFTKTKQLFGAVLSSDKYPIIPSPLSACDNNIVVALIPIWIERTQIASVLLVWRPPIPYPRWAGVIDGIGKSVFIDEDYLYISACYFQGTERGEFCLVWRIDNQVEYFTHIGEVQQEKIDMIKRQDEISALIREGKTPFPIAEEDSLLWVSALVSMDARYVRMCSEAAGIPQIREVEFSPTDGKLRCPKLLQYRLDVNRESL